MLTGAFATSCYGIPRSTKDVDIVPAINAPSAILGIIQRLSPVVKFNEQVQFETLTWGKRQVGCTRKAPYFKVELFELFDDPFVQSQFHRRVNTLVGTPGRDVGETAQYSGAMSLTKCKACKGKASKRATSCPPLWGAQIPKRSRPRRDRARGESRLAHHVAGNQFADFVRLSGL